MKKLTLFLTGDVGDDLNVLHDDLIVIARNEFGKCLPDNSTLSYSIMRGLVSRLRQADRLGLSVLVCVPPPNVGVGLAVNDRLGRAAASSRPGHGSSHVRWRNHPATAVDRNNTGGQGKFDGGTRLGCPAASTLVASLFDFGSSPITSTPWNDRGEDSAMEGRVQAFKMVAAALSKRCRRFCARCICSTSVSRRNWQWEGD